MKRLSPGNGRAAGVVGMGRSGTAAARLLADRGYSVTGFDSSRTAFKPEYVHSLITGDPEPEDMANLSLLIVSPGVPTCSPIIRQAQLLGIQICPEVELGWACTDADVIGVTGSNGKTTTVEWLGHVLRSSRKYGEAVVAGNMGYALSDAVLDNPECPVYSLELSSYQLEAIEDLRVVSAAILNLTPDHLARHGSMENYGASKARILMNQLPGDTAVLNMDDPLLIPMMDSVKGKLLLFSLDREVPEGAWLDPAGVIRFKGLNTETAVISRKDLAVPGRHNIANALAVVCLAMSFGIPASSLSESLGTFKGVPHRIEFLGTHRNIQWVNDSKSTNVDSLRVALESFAGKVILLAGGQEKDSDYSVLRDLVKSSSKAVILFGTAAETLESQWSGSSEIYRADDLQGAVDRALDIARSGDTVLLSPGCASFDQYRNFEERGEHFRKIVGEMS